MKNHAFSSEKMPFYQKVLNLTLGIGNSPSRHGVVTDDSPVASSPFRRGYTRHSTAHPPPTAVVGSVTPSPMGTPVKNSSSASSAAASIFRSFRRRSLRRSFRRTKSFLVKNPTDSFVNSQEWTLSRSVPDLRLGIVGSLASGKSALVHRYLTGSYMQEESPEGGRFKKEIMIDGQSYLLLIRDEGGSPELQFTAWVDAVIFVFSLENEASFNAVYNYHAKMAQFRNIAEIPFILVGTQDGISENNPRVIDDARARKLATDLRRCSYYETCATYGLNVERVFQDACQKILQQRIAPMPSPTSTPRPTTPNHYSLGRHYSTSITSGPAAHGGYGAGPGFSSSSLSSVVAGSTLGPAGAAIGTGHSGLAGYNGSSHNLHSSVANLNANGALAARAAMPPPPPHGSYVNHYPNPKTNSVPQSAGNNSTPRRATSTNSTLVSGHNAPAPLHSNTAPNSNTNASSEKMPSSQSSSNVLGSAESLTLRNTPPSNTDQLTVPGNKDGKDLPTPSSTPTTSRKSRRRSNLFTPSSKKDDKDKEKEKEKNKNGAAPGGELGSGRAIPIKQGYLYKRSHKALNKDWKKKYVTLCDDGKLTYHSSLHDYMDDSHGKEISLQYVTVKVPGQKPRGSRGTQTQSVTNAAFPAGGATAATMTPSANGANDPLVSMAGYGPNKDKRADKVLLTAYEVLKEPAGRNLSTEDPTVMQNALNGDAIKSDTPSVKKRHRRMKSSSNKANDLEDCDGFEFQIVSLDNKVWHFEAASVDEREEWVTAIEHQILSSLQGNESSKSKSRMNSLVDAASIQSLKSTVIGNSHCADCDAPNPDWASLNLGILVCIECSGIHRNLGSHISRVRSLDLDEWPPGHIAVMLGLGNTVSNSIWEARIRGVKPNPQSSREEKERWIRAKYENKEFLANLPSTAPLGQQLVEAVCRSDLRTTALILARCGPDDVNCSVSGRDLRTPLHLASTLGHLALVQLLLWHNANVKALDHDGRTCLTFARSSNSLEVVELLVGNGCPEGPANTGINTLTRRKTLMNTTSSTNLIGKLEQGI